MKLPKLVITDIDGVWTDGGMFYSDNGIELKKFNTSDSAGVLFLKLKGIPFAIITGENTEIVSRRAQKLKVKNVFLGVKNKVLVAEGLCKEYKIGFDEIAFIGDDINDMPLLKKVGFSSAPFNAPEYVRNSVDFITIKKGGEGAFREFVEYILSEAGVFEEVLDEYYQNLNGFNQ